MKLVRLCEYNEDEDDKLKIFNSLKKGDVVKIKYGSAMADVDEPVEFVVTSRRKVNKGTVEKVTLSFKDSPKKTKAFLYKHERYKQPTFAIGDMGATIHSISL